MMGPVGPDSTPRGMDRPERAEGPGKKMQAVGQKAKMAVAMAREAGVELPKDAQGMAASGLARGADAESLFASLVDPEPTETPDQPDDTVTDMTAKSFAVPIQDVPPELLEE